MITVSVVEMVLDKVVRVIAVRDSGVAALVAM
jgi:hypothetical protein